jgi:predicted esterase
LQGYGRGGTRYKGAGTDDVFSAMAEVSRDYEVDADRTYLTGGSMGGAGTWFLATHYPGVFAAAAPLCGYTDYRLDFGSSNAKLDWEHSLYRAHDALTSANNLKSTPVYFCHGDQDIPGAYGTGVDVAHSRVMAKRLKELGLSFTYDELPGVKHGIPRAQYEKSEKWLLDFRRDPNPKQVTFETSSLQFHCADWIDIEGLEKHFHRSSIEAKIAGSQLEVRTEGVTHFAVITGGAVPYGTLSCEINGQRLDVSGGSTDRLHFTIIGGKWRQAAGVPEGIRKRSGLQGPWIDPFTQPALYVVPSDHSAYAQLAAYDLEILQRSHGGLDCSNVRGRLEIEIPIKKDRDVTAGDMAARNLIIFGDPQSNSLLARLHNRLPIRWSSSALLAGNRRYEGDRVGVKFVFPNPLNPARYVAVAMGTSAEALYALRIFHWQLPDFLIFGPEAVRAGDVPYYNAAPEHTKLLEGAYLAAGFFDEQWRLPGS